MKTSFSHPLRVVELLTHVIGWGLVFGFPLYFVNRFGEVINWTDYLRHSLVPLSFLIIFYVNYFLLVPRYLFGERMKQYVILNLILVIAMTAGLHWWQTYLFNSSTHLRPTDHSGPPVWVFIARDLFSMILTIGLSAAIKMSRRFAQVEASRREAEKSRTEAELKNLQNQLNPHFLLNTLNNIYALIAFDTDRAQQAVQELSRLLRHALYDNQQNYTPLIKEIDFIRNYIELMRIRLSNHITVEMHINVADGCETAVAPLLFISLIENAFKHGISPIEPSFIRIVFTEKEGTITCQISNSYHPKTATDKSGSGIGLEQVGKRLELLYANRYSWKYGVTENKKEYQSTLILKP